MDREPRAVLTHLAPWLIHHQSSRKMKAELSSPALGFLILTPTPIPLSIAALPLASLQHMCGSKAHTCNLAKHTWVCLMINQEFKPKEKNH